MATVLVTGGAGFIGTHTLVELLRGGHRVVCVDSYVNSAPEALRRVEKIAGKPVRAVTGDVRDFDLMRRLLADEAVDSVIHFAALKAVGESVVKPLEYYENNVGGALSLLRAMRETNVRKIVFSSSATVYGAPDALPIREDAPIRTSNPYGATKAMIERILEDLAAADPTWAIATLRYFNPIGAHESGLIGEDPADVPNNLFPFIAQVAAGRRPHLGIFGNDWPTPDGTGVRDYIHVVDLAIGHLRALEYAASHPGFLAVNLGTGRGTSVLELVRAFETATGVKVPYEFTQRRAGDVATCWADPSLAAERLRWHAERSVAQACADGWRWQSGNPGGYGSRAL
jgi:UDP-glucose 4-epimerase